MFLTLEQINCVSMYYNGKNRFGIRAESKFVTQGSTVNIFIYERFLRSNELCVEGREFSSWRVCRENYYENTIDTKGQRTQGTVPPPETPIFGRAISPEVLRDISIIQSVNLNYWVYSFCCIILINRAKCGCTVYIVHLDNRKTH